MTAADRDALRRRAIERNGVCRDLLEKKHRTAAETMIAAALENLRL